MKHLFLIGLLASMGLAWSQEPPSADLVQGLDVPAERSLIAKERKRSDETYKAALKVCFQKIAVNACKDEARAIKFEKDNELRRRELVLNDLERRNNSAKALKNVEERQSAESQAQQEQRRLDAQEQHLDKLQTNIDKREERLKKEAEMAANREARAKQLEDLLERRRAHETKLKEAARKQELHERKLQEAEQHRAQVEKDRAKRNQGVQPLPARSTTQP